MHCTGKQQAFAESFYMAQAARQSFFAGLEGGKKMLQQQFGVFSLSKECIQKSEVPGSWEFYKLF